MAKKSKRQVHKKSAKKVAVSKPVAAKSVKNVPSTPAQHANAIGPIDHKASVAKPRSVRGELIFITGLLLFLSLVVYFKH